MAKLKKKNKLIEICPFCKRPKDHRWIEVSIGHSRYYRFCCEEKSMSNDQPGFLVHKYKEAVAFGFDKLTGQPLAIDKKGKRFDPHETRYADYYNDQHGWQATGKVKPRKTYHI